MPLSSPSAIGTEINSAINAIGIVGGTPITEEQKIQIWTIVVEKIYTDLQTNASVAPGSFVVPSGPSAGPIAGLGGPIE